MLPIGVTFYYNDDDELEIILEASNLEGIDEDTMNSAATVFLNNEIGEKEIIELVKEYTIVIQLEEEDVQDKFSVSGLKEHLFSDE